MVNIKLPPCPFLPCLSYATGDPKLQRKIKFFRLIKDQFNQTECLIISTAVHFQSVFVIFCPQGLEHSNFSPSKQSYIRLLRLSSIRKVLTPPPLFEMSRRAPMARGFWVDIIIKLLSRRMSCIDLFSVSTAGPTLHGQYLYIYTYRKP